MAGEALETRLVIEDEASEALKEIAAQSEAAESALAEVEEAVDVINSAGKIDIEVTASADEARNNIKDAIKKLDNEKWEAEVNAVVDTGLTENAGAGNDSRWEEEVDKFIEVFDILASGEIGKLEKELNELKDIGTPDAEGIGEKVQEIMEQDEEAWQNVLADVEAQSEKILKDWDDAEKGIVEIPKEATEQAEKTGQDLKKGVRGLGADIAGWWSIIKDVFGKIADAFGKLAEESDKLSTRMARFGMVADSEGKTGAARNERSGQLYKEHQKFAQALGVQSEAFNETVLNMYSNGAGIVKSIEEAQTIAASSYMAMDIAGLRGRDKDAVMGEIQSMVSVGIADPDQIQEAMKIAPNILRTIEKQWQANQNGKAFKLNNGEEITDATGKIAVLAQEGQITADLVAQAMVNSAKETNETWKTLPSTWEKLENRIKTITENMVFDILEEFGKLADDPQVADFVTSALELGEKIVTFTKDYILPVIGGVLRAIMSVLTSIFQTLSQWQTAIPVIVAVGVVLANAAVKAGLLTKAITGIKAAMAAIAANPFILVAAGIMVAALAVAHWVRTTQEGQEAMLEVTAALMYTGQQVAAFFTNMPDILKSAWRGLKSYLYESVTKILEVIASALETLGEFSDTAKEAAKGVRDTINERYRVQMAFDNESAELKRGWQGDFKDNYDFYQDYRKRIPEIAKENLEKNKDDLKLTGFLDRILGQLEHAPGTPPNPAHVKGKVAIDGEYFDIIKRAAGIEIVNRYTTLRPTVNAKFGDIHQVDAQDILGELGRSIQDAEGAAISDAQALGA